MANQVEKLDTIAIADIEKVNTLTDANIEKINTLEFTGTSTYALFSWGDNGTYGQMGDGSKASKCSPVLIGDAFFGELDVDGEGVQQLQGRISSGGAHSAAIKADGTLWAWGNGNNGALGVGDTVSYCSPVQVGSLTDWRSISFVYTDSTVATKTDGTLWGWGQSDHNGHSFARSSPVQVGTDTDWSYAIGSGGTFGWGLKTDGSLYLWGTYNAYLGVGVAAPGPPQLITDKKFVYMGAGAPNAIVGVEKTTGKLWSWGTNNGAGMLGHGNETHISSPVQIGSATDWRWAGGAHSSFVYSNSSNEIWGAGLNHDGFFGLGTVGNLDTVPTYTYSAPVQIPDKTWAEYGHSTTYGWCHAITDSGELWAVGGSGGNGTPGTGTEGPYSSPVQVGTDTTWVCLNNLGGGGRTNSTTKLAIKQSS